MNVSITLKRANNELFALFTITFYLIVTVLKEGTKLIHV